MSMSNTTKTVQVKCTKCDGKGKLWFYSHLDNGVCYACKGAGTVSGESVTARQAARFRAACGLDSLTEAGDRMIAVNPKWTQHTVRRVAADMLIVADTVWARRMLATVPSGLRAMLIAAGRELKTA